MTNDPDARKEPAEIPAQDPGPPPRSADIVIIGSGMGGGTLAYALRHLDARILVLERGDFLPQEPQYQGPCQERRGGVCHQGGAGGGEP